MKKCLLLWMLYCCMYLQHSYAQTFPDLKFSSLTLNTTIPDNFLTVAFKDSRGLMWFGSENNGLLRYDGKKVKSYYSINNDRNGISANHISYIAEDKNGWLWISTLDGLYHFDPVTENKVLYRHNANNKNCLADNEKPRPFIDSRGRLWACGVKGLQQLDTARKSFINYTTPPINNPEWQLNALGVNLVFEDSKQHLWGGNAYGIYLIDTVSHNCKPYYTGVYRYVTGICEDTSGQLWVSFSGGGLKLFHPGTGRFEDVAFPGTLVNLMTLWEDENEKQWLSFSIDRTLILFDPVTRKYKAYNQDPFNPVALKGTSFRYIYSDNENRLLVLSNEGILVVDRQLQNFTNHLLYADVDKIDKNKFGIPRSLLQTQGGYQLSVWAFGPLYHYDENWKLEKKIKSISPQFPHFRFKRNNYYAV